MKEVVQGVIVLKTGREKSVIKGHPWIFSGAVKEIIGQPKDGSTIIIKDSQSNFLAYAAYSSKSQIIARVWSKEEDEIINETFFEKKLSQAIAYRKNICNSSQTNAYRLVYAESDGLPGIIVDKYGDVLVLQCLTCGADFWRNEITTILIDIERPSLILERSDSEVRQLEGLPLRKQVLFGELKNQPIIIQEEKTSCSYYVDIFNGQKSGFYLDQRENRAVVKALAGGKNVLDCFCYSGGFSIAALLGGAKSVIAVDSSSDALRLVEKNLALNNLPQPSIELYEEDVFRFLRLMRDKNRKFDIIILDPPKFAPTVHQVDKAARGYKDINLLAFKLLNPQGILVTFSCSGGVDSSLLQKILAAAALDAQVKARVLFHLHQAADHVISLHFPEGEYLKGFVLQIS